MMSACEKEQNGRLAAPEALSTQALRERLDQLMDADDLTDADSGEMLELLKLLEQRDDGDYLRVDTDAALKTFRETYLPSVETETAACEPAARFPGALPAFVAAFSAGKAPTPQEEDALRHMIDEFRKEQ